MHRLTIGAFLLVFALVYFGMRKGYGRTLHAVQWGRHTWGVFCGACGLLCVVFVCVYGEYYDWLDGEPDTDRGSSLRWCCCFCAFTVRRRSAILT